MTLSGWCGRHGQAGECGCAGCGNRVVAAFADAWGTWHVEYDGSPIPRPAGWQTTIERFYTLGVPVDELTHCVRVACGNDNVRASETFRYFCGCMWRVVTEMQDAAKELLDAEVGDGA